MIAERTVVATAYGVRCVRSACIVGAALAAALENAPHRLT